jgi:hypothetical protein
VDSAVIGYLQQPLLSQQAGSPQQATTVAAWAASETKRTAANVNTSALNFTKIVSFEMLRLTQACATVTTHTYRKVEEEMDLNAEIVFEIKDLRLIKKPASQFAAGPSYPRLRLMAERSLFARKRLRSLLLTLLLDSLLGRNRVRRVAGRAGFAGIVSRLRAAG